MVPLAPVPTEFAGRVLVAKLGSAGIIAELRGVSGVYPTVFDSPHVWVEAAELADARELISADVDDELAAAPSDARVPIVAARSPLRALLVAVAVVLLAALSIGPRACAPVTRPASVRTP